MQKSQLGQHLEQNKFVELALDGLSMWREHPLEALDKREEREIGQNHIEGI